MAATTSTALMRESVDPRTGVHPTTGVALLAPGSGADHPVNASERNIEPRDDLQYACVFERGELGPLDCALPENALGCDCEQSPSCRR